MGFWFLVSSFLFRVSGLAVVGVPAAVFCFRFLVSGFWFLVSGFWFRVSDVPFVRHWEVCLSGRRDGDDY